MHDRDEEDRRLIDAVRGGDRAAFLALLSAHGPSVRRLARVITGRDADADDVLQDTFLSAWRGREALRSDGSPRAWLLAIARNAARRRVRREALVRAEEPSLLDLGLAAGWGAEDDADPESLAAAHADREALARALESLPHDDREVIVLRDLDGLSGEEVAATLGLSLAAQKSRLHRARLRLMAALREGGGHGRT